MPGFTEAIKTTERVLANILIVRMRVYTLGSSRPGECKSFFEKEFLARLSL